MDSFREQVKKGFQACKSDIQSLNSSQNALFTKVTSLENENKDLKEQISNLSSLIETLNSQLSSLSTQPKEEKQPEETLYNDPVVSEVAQKKPVKEEKKDPYEALLAFKAKTNKREVIKQKMISMIGENGMHLAELKFMIVEHFKYCSKATFYNYLKELELEKHIKIERENTKNYVYLSHALNNRLDNR